MQKTVDSVADVSRNTTRIRRSKTEVISKTLIKMNVVSSRLVSVQEHVERRDVHKGE